MEAEDSALPYEPASGGPSALDTVAQHEVAERVTAAMSGPIEYRETVVLRFQEGLGGGDRDPYQAPVGHGEVAPVPCLEYADGSPERSTAMTQSSHQEIRRLIATSGDDLSEAQQALLHAHLQDCGSRRDYAATAEIGRALRGCHWRPIPGWSSTPKLASVLGRLHCARDNSG
jgi:hypothetical protein